MHTRSIKLFFDLLYSFYHSEQTKISLQRTGTEMERIHMPLQLPCSRVSFIRVLLYIIFVYLLLDQLLLKTKIIIKLSSGLLIFLAIGVPTVPIRFHYSTNYFTGKCFICKKLRKKKTQNQFMWFSSF